MYNWFMSNTTTIEQFLDNPVLLLAPEVLEDINSFAETNKNEYKAYDPDSSEDHFMDCKIYSLKLKRLLNQKHPELNISFFIVCDDSEEDKLLGTIPKHAVHCSLCIKDLGIVIEPQTARILWIDKSKTPNANDYYKKGLGKEEVFYMTTDQVKLPKLGPQN